MSELIHTHKIKEPDAKERQILALLQQPGVEQKIDSMAAAMSETFSVQTRLLTDIRPGAIILDNQTKIQFIYEGSYAPFDFDPLTIAIMRKARRPIEEMPDQSYTCLRVRGISTQSYIMAMADLIKLVVVNRFKVTDFNINDEKELTKNLF